MNPTTNRNPLLASLALAGLMAYVLACSSFSPDDSKIACPAFDPQTGDFGAAVYDRKSGRLEQVFSFGSMSGKPESKYKGCWTRMQWIDKNRLLVGWTGGDEDKALHVAVVPHGAAGPVRIWQIDDLSDPWPRLLTPFALAGNRLFVVVNKSNLVARLDLQTGRIEHHLCAGDKIALYPAGRSEQIFYAAVYEASGAGQSDKLEFGTLDAGTFKQSLLLRTDNQDLNEQLAFSPDGRRIATIIKRGEKKVLSILQAGKEARTIPLPGGDEADFEDGGLCFSPTQDVVFVSYQNVKSGETKASLGVLTVPLDGKPIERTVLVPAIGGTNSNNAPFFQATPSHDGMTLAVATSYFFGDPEKTQGSAKDCALFLIDVTTRPHKITRVPLALPKKDKPFK